MKKAIPKKSDDIAEWYTRLILAADLADYGPVKGTMIFKPYGYAIWEEIQRAIDPLIKARGVSNAYFPLFIPMNLLEREKEHVKGFAPELAVVTHGGGEKLEEPLAIRPTSETIMYEAFARWVQSWRDLPMMMNQWNNVVRWEKRTYMFMRTSEFLWQEGHTAHAAHQEAIETQQWAMDMYEKIYKDYFALFGYVGFKSQNERFAGADATLTYEALMPSGKALQSATSHDLGQNFAKTFGIKFQDKTGRESYAWQTSWGLSTRSIGGLILAHGDDNGLVLPPRLAPFQVVILPVRIEENMVKAAEKLRDELTTAGLRCLVDARDDETIGFRINKWELKGAPLRIELGEREIAGGKLTVSRRDTGEKLTISAQKAPAELRKLLENMQSSMLQASQDFTDKNTNEADDYDEFKKLMKNHKGFIKVHWDENPADELKIKAETTATSRCKLLAETEKESRCFFSNKKTSDVWLFAQSY